jgi:hypothetical protein
VSSLTGQDSLIVYAKNELAELVRALEQTLSKPRATKEPDQRFWFIKYNGGLQINTSLLSVVLHD